MPGSRLRCGRVWHQGAVRRFLVPSDDSGVLPITRCCCGLRGHRIHLLFGATCEQDHGQSETACQDCIEAVVPVLLLDPP